MPLLSLYGVCLFKQWDGILRCCSIFKDMWSDPIHSTRRSRDQFSNPPQVRNVCEGPFRACFYVAVTSIPSGGPSKNQDLKGMLGILVAG